FFQAEDGIRDRNVTGVQTCALPISWSVSKGIPGDRPFGRVPQCGRRILRKNSRLVRSEFFTTAPKRRKKGPLQLFAVSHLFIERSEERRVGKGCSSSRWDGHCRERE